MYYLEKMFTVILSDNKAIGMLHTGFNVIKSNLILSESYYYSSLPKTQDELSEDYGKVLNKDFKNLKYHYIPVIKEGIKMEECSKYKEITRDEYYLYEDIITQHDSLTLKFRK